MLLLKKPMRLFTDIDIVVEPGIDIDNYIDKAGKLFPFVRVEEQKRVGKNSIEKRHFKFAYLSPASGREVNCPLITEPEKYIDSKIALKEYQKLSYI